VRARGGEWWFGSEAAPLEVGACEGVEDMAGGEMHGSIDAAVRELRVSGDNVRAYDDGGCAKHGGRGGERFHER